ncbi:alpha/beta hydrolase [Halorussus gelatinilyticus]|uniref:Alpha/beta hydrolase n=1 Tax=Halorussus gelatinilyticus TaxID=2937524 RepID=A0A8U0IGX9_9EURY|nr:alpha/beta hydrolase [Halorussus gelatinilyticus]UPW00233.1 alpha/beta hydrolase [Halorussus gelatinilyticus]
MKLRNVAAGVAGGLGAAALGNGLLSWKVGDLDPALEGRQGTYRWRGFDVAYTEAGDPDDPDVLLLHGVHAAASNKEFDQIFDQLAKTHHVVAPDLPGFGRSDRPPLTYSAALYTAFVTDFAEDVTEDAACVATSLSGAYATLAQHQSSPFTRLVLVAPTGDTGPRRTWLRSLIRSPLVGQALFNLLTSKRSLHFFDNREAYSTEASYTESDVDYQWETAHQPGARFAPASFVSGYLDPDVDLGEELVRLDVPVTIVWGRDATVSPLEEGEELAEQADAKLVVFDEAKLLPHAEHPGPFLDVLLDELTEEAVESEPGRA